MASRTQVTKRRRANRQTKLQKNRSRKTKRVMRRMKSKGYVVP